MSKSRRLSIGSAPCRLEWRPSRVAGALLLALAVLAPLAVLGSHLPRAAAWPLALAAAARGLRDARRYRRQPPIAIVVPAAPGEATCDGTPVPNLAVGWRGPLAVLRWRQPDGRPCRRILWPDTLGSGGRRELRVALMRREPAPEAASMAG